MSSIARALLIDEASWRRHRAFGGLRTGALIVIGAFALMAFGRFGPAGFVDPRGAVRMLLVGSFGWIGLTIGVRQMRPRDRTAPSFARLAGLIGRAHLPLLLLGVVIQVASVTLQWFVPSRLGALFVALVWLPAMLATATGTAFDSGTRRSLAIVVGPYVVWAATTGWYVFVQVRHLL